MSERTEKDDPDSAAAACPICGGSAALAYTAGDYHYGIPGRFSVHRCGQCQHLFQWPMPSEDELGWYYPGEYYSFQPPTVDARPHALRRRGLGPLAHYAGLRRGYRHLRRFPNPLLALLGWRLARLRPDIVLPRFVAGGTLCDFGCGAGANVAVMQYLGWNASGIDASATAAAAGRRAGLNIIEGSAEVLECRPEAFDAIVAAHSVVAGATRRRARQGCGPIQESSALAEPVGADSSPDRLPAVTAERARRLPATGVQAACGTRRAK